MASKKINVLIYAGPSTSLPSVRHATWTLRRLLGAQYSIQTISSDQLLKEPWPSTCALLIVPGGADSGYCRLLNGAGNRRIKAYLQGGGKYLGLCAGGYYGCSKCEFEVGRKGWEVVGDRELGFYPGICRGLAFSGFVYGSEKGARAVKLRIKSEALNEAEGAFNSYYNGGGVFVDAEKLRDRGVEVLATFEEDLAVEAGEPKAAVVYCAVGEGGAILTGPHPEFAGINLHRDEPSNPKYGELIDALLATDSIRTEFLKACLSKLGLEVSKETQAVPSLSRLHLSSAQPGEIEDLLQRWLKEGLLAEDHLIKGENDTFKIQAEDGWSLGAIKQAMKDILPDAVTSSTTSTPSAVEKEKAQADSASADRILDYNAVSKTLVPHTQSSPSPKETPHWNHSAFYSHLERLQSLQPALAGDWGRVLLYGEVVTSTQTILEKNPTLLSHLPIGTTAVATTQVSGRGRGTNVWVSPPGQLIFSTTFKHSMSLSSSAPVVFVQYLAAMATVLGIRAYDRGFDKLPIKLKWPNDIYALDPSSPSTRREAYIKIGGLIVNSSYSGGDYTLIVGIGLNVSNAAPTTCLDALVRKTLPQLRPRSGTGGVVSPEQLLASILVNFEALYARFCQTGFSSSLEQMYYGMWLHSGQVVRIESEGDKEARIAGITRDWGLLVAEEVGGRGGRWELQSDSNSFDFLRGLVRRKV